MAEAKSDSDSDVNERQKKRRSKRKQPTADPSIQIASVKSRKLGPSVPPTMVDPKSDNDLLLYLDDYDKVVELVKRQHGDSNPFPSEKKGKVLNKKREHEALRMACTDPSETEFVRKVSEMSEDDPMDGKSTPPHALSRQKVPPVCRADEEAMMRQPIRKEPACCKGVKCYGLQVMIPASQRFILRAFYFREEEAKYASIGEWPSEPRRCILCMRARECKRFMHNEALKIQCKAGYVIQSYRNIRAPGEYRLEDCMLNGSDGNSGVIDPVVKLCLNSFKPKEVDGVKYLEQTLERPKADGEDF